MVDYYPLDKIFVQGTNYELPNDRFYVIKKIGTDATSATKLKIDGVDTGPIINSVAPLHKTSSNLLGPLDLGNLFYVVPPNKTFSVEGASGAKFRCIGLIGKLAPGEAMPAQYAGRFNEQGKHYLTYVTGSKDVGTDVSWAAGAEYEVYSLTPKTIEQYIFNNVVMASISGDTVAEGDFGIIFYLDGTPLDILTTDPGKKGIDVLSMPSPPAATTEETPFTLKDLPIKVEGDHTFKVTAINNSGAAKAPASGSSWSITLKAIVEYIMRG